MEKCSIMVCVCSLYLTLGVKFYESVTFELFLNRPLKFYFGKRGIIIILV